MLYEIHGGMKNGTKIPITSIQVGPRHRKDLGRLEDLAASIRQLGLLHPVVVTPDHRLIAGQRRLGAAKLLGWTEIPITIIDLENILEGESAENFCRAALLPSEQVAIAEAMLELEKKKAKERQGRPGKGRSGKLPEHSRARDKVAAAGGTSGRTLEKARAVVKAAEADPEKFGPLVEQMDRTGKVDRAYRVLQAEIDIKRPDDPSRVEVLEAEPSTYSCIYADPPWDYGDRTCSGGVGLQYKTMTLEEICRLPIPELCSENGAHLWLWTTWPMIRDGQPHELLKAWGFRWVGEIVWVKPGLGVGRWLRPSTEVLILAERGGLKLLRKNQKGHVEAKRMGHSVKPPYFYELIESLSPGPRIELFARRPHKGWRRWGNQA